MRFHCFFKIVPICNRSIRGKVKIMQRSTRCFVRTPDHCNGMNRFLEGWIAPYLVVVITWERLSYLACPLRHRGHLYDHIFCLSVISSGTFMRNWAMCKKVWAESQFFLKHGRIHFLGFLLIPNYNHDKIIREFRRPRRRTVIFCLVMEGYALIAVRRWIVWAYVCLQTIVW